MADWTIRDATEADLEAVRRVLAETWTASYAPGLGHDVVASLSAAWHSVENLRRDVDAADRALLLAERDGHCVAMASARFAAPDLHLTRLYVRPAWQRRGLGGKLLTAIEARYPAAAATRLDVEADNAAAITFYRWRGFRAVGETTEEVARGVHLTSLRMQRPRPPK